MKVLVTGGAGYIGAHVVRHLDECGHVPIILDDLRRSHMRRIGPYICEKVGLEDTPAVFRVFEHYQPDAIIHLAGYISVGESVKNPDMYWQNNLRASTSLILACAKFPVKTFLFSSTAATYGDVEKSPIPETAPNQPTCAYGASKLEFERLLHQSGRVLGFRSFALRYFNACGANVKWGVGEDHDPEEHLIPRVVRWLREGRKVQVYGNDYPTPDGTCVRDYIHVSDLASAHVAVIESPRIPGGQSFNVGTGTGYSVLQVIQAVGEYLQVKPDIEFLPRRPGDPATLVADASQLMSKLEWKPEHSSLKDIVASAVEWEKERSSHAVQKA
ncbi:MAG TPA: UDP-glucose 4-epimerase GalE [Verrucomicrobiae bacterium]|jgi:UDP-glucose 4-epimerase|nr:UDP-glucose 4-epimerase GalE [Verrucomicrobiae bacterium]